MKSDNLDLVGLRPSVAIALNREAVCATLARFPVRNPRVFGSVLHGTDREGSDLDLLVDPLPGTTLFDLSGLQEALEELLGINVDVLTAGDISRRFRDRVLAEARPLGAPSDWSSIISNTSVRRPTEPNATSRT